LFINKYTNFILKSYLSNFYESQGHLDFKYLENANYIIEECLECGLIYQKEILNDFLMEKLYEEWINPHLVFKDEEKTFGLDYYARYAQEIGTIIAHFNVIPSRLSFFDFGMGWGKWLKMVNSFGVNSYGTELSQSRINYAKKFGINILSWEELINQKFDFINAEQVFEHIPQPFETLLHLKKALKPGGLIKISVPNGADIKKRLKIADWKAEKNSKNSLNSISPLEHINCFNNSSIIKMAQKAGLKQVSIPLLVQYSFICNNTSLKNLLINLVKPFYRNYMKGTYLFFTINDNQ
jgi:2-polyprenyl-3-methyl-5-hydroxy-6-metoxy-1,4-benzoquinol methylase